MTNSEQDNRSWNDQGDNSSAVDPIDTTTTINDNNINNYSNNFHEPSSKNSSAGGEQSEDDTLFSRSNKIHRFFKLYIEKRFGELTWKSVILRGLRFLAVFLFSQVISSLLTCTGIFSTFLTNKFHINLPTLQNAISYVTLLVFYFPLLMVHKWCYPTVEKLNTRRRSRSSGSRSSTITLSRSSSISSGRRRGEDLDGEMDDSTAEPTATVSSEIKQCFTSIVKRLYSGERWNMKPWKYFFFALADVEANFMVVKAYQYTTITSVMLLDCFTIPSVMLLSFLFLNRSYRWTHIVGVFICLGGLGLLVLSDYLRSISEAHHESSENPWYYLLLGDALCIAGSFCYAISNVAQEYALKSEDHFSQLMNDHSPNPNHNNTTTPNSPSHEQEEVPSSNTTDAAANVSSPPHIPELIQSKKPRLTDNDCAIEYLAMVGFFGTLIATIQTVIFERDELMNTKWSPESIMYMIGFALSMFFIYTLVPHLIRWSSATFMNLSFLTSDIFAVITSVFLFGQSIYPLYYFAYSIIAIGLVFYNVLQEEERKSKSLFTKGRLLIVKCFKRR